MEFRVFQRSDVPTGTPPVYDRAFVCDKTIVWPAPVPATTTVITSSLHALNQVNADYGLGYTQANYVLPSRVPW